MKDVHEEDSRMPPTFYLYHFDRLNRNKFQAKSVMRPRVKELIEELILRFFLDAVTEITYLSDIQSAQGRYPMEA